MSIYKFNDQQFEQIQSALNAAIGMALRFDKSMIDKMSAASSMMDDVANEDEDAPDLLEALQELLQAYSEPDSRLCCDGRDCGCMGSTVRQQAEHYARETIAKATTLTIQDQTQR